VRWQLPLFAVLVHGPSMAPALRSGADLLVVKRAVHPQDGGWWVRGDNEFVQDDSRAYGVADVIGRVLIRYYPRPGRLG
jgi:phage repressor protein C with HTH and peptisase S24 domain